MNNNQENSSCRCDCKTQPHFRRFDSNYYYIGNGGIEEHLEDLYLNDRFPLPACPDEKGILFMNDVTVYCYYNDGWEIFSVTRGGEVT